MEFQTKLSNNLVLHYAELNKMDDDDRVITVTFYFSFFGQYCHAVLHRDDLYDPWPSFVFLESPSEIHDSFKDQLEDVHHAFLVRCFLEFQNDHNSDYEIDKRYALAIIN